MIAYELKNNSIFEISLTEKVDMNDILDFLKEFETLNYLPNDVKLIYDFQNAELELDIDQLTEISKTADEVTLKYKTVRTAFVVSEPVVTAYSYLFSKMDKRKNIERKVFSTTKAAREWLLHD